MITHRSHQGPHPHIAARSARAHLSRLVTVLAAVTCGLLASVAAVPAAFARMVPPPGAAFARLVPPLGAPYGPAPLPPTTTTHVITIGGMAGWQIVLIALGAAVVAACTAVLLDRARSARRSPSATTA
jgi:hypothetical protein